MPESTRRRGGARALPGRGDRIRRSSAGGSRARFRRSTSPRGIRRASGGWIDEAAARSRCDKVRFLVVPGLGRRRWRSWPTCVLPAATFAEKAGMLRQCRRTACSPPRRPCRRRRGTHRRAGSFLDLPGSVAAWFTCRRFRQGTGRRDPRTSRRSGRGAPSDGYRQSNRRQRRVGTATCGACPTRGGLIVGPESRRDW